MGIIGFISSCVLFGANLIDFLPKTSLKFKNKSISVYILYAVLHLLLGVLILTAGAMLTDKAVAAKEAAAQMSGLTKVFNPFTKTMVNVIKSASDDLDLYMAGGAFGIITGIVFTIDAVLHVVFGKKVYGA